MMGEIGGLWIVVLNLVSVLDIARIIGGVLYELLYGVFILFLLQMVFY